MYKFNDHSALLHLYSKHIFHQWRHRPIYNITLDTTHSAQYTGHKTDYFSNIKSTPSMILYLSPWIYNSYNKQTKLKSPWSCFLCVVHVPYWAICVRWCNPILCMWDEGSRSSDQELSKSYGRHGFHLLLGHVCQKFTLLRKLMEETTKVYKKRKGICQKNKLYSKKINIGCPPKLTTILTPPGPSQPWTEDLSNWRLVGRETCCLIYP